MAEDLDVEAMLEAPYKKGDDGSGSRSHRENGNSGGSHKSSGMFGKMLVSTENDFIIVSRLVLCGFKLFPKLKTALKGTDLRLADIQQLVKSF